MKDIFIRSLFVIIIFLSFSSVVLSQTQVNDRRVEENKRKDLQSTEYKGDRERARQPSAAPAPMRPLDRMYFAELIMKKVTYRYDICKIIAILMKKENEYISLDAQIMLLTENHFLPRHLESDFDPQQPLRRGVAAFIFSKALDIQGGWSIRTFGLNERSAINELVYQGIMSAGNVRDILSGEELISIFTQSVNHRKNNAP